MKHVIHYGHNETIEIFTTPDNTVWIDAYSNQVPEYLIEFSVTALADVIEALQAVQAEIERGRS